MSVQTEPEVGPQPGGHQRADAAATPTPICMVGFGDVGYHWVSTLLEAGHDRDAVVVLYLPHDAGRLERARSKADELGVTLVTNPSDVPDTTRLYFHATTAATAAEVLDQCLSSLRSADTWVDVNSTGPAVKRQMAEAVAERGAGFVDGAIMGPAWKLGHRTPVWVSGSGTNALEAWAEHWGMPTVIVDGPAGAAASIKMCRSVILKGFAASLVEGLTLAELIGVLAPVLESLTDDLGSEVVDAFCQRFVRPTMQHAHRRAGEVVQAMEMGQELEFEVLTADGVSRYLERVARVGGAEIAERDDDMQAILGALGRATRAAAVDRE